MSLFKKALGAFVEFEEGKEQPPASQAAAGESPATPEAALPDAPADLSADPDVQRVQQAIQLLSSLPLTDIPVEKARELIVRTLQFAGMDPEALIGSFQRAEELYRSQIRTEQELMESRKKLNAERLALLEAAIQEEKAQCEAELTARTERIDKANLYLTEIDKAMAFFAAEEPKE
ncbi:MAG: hypothetical protein ACOY93_15870 [Bacillota bacterium]